MGRKKHKKQLRQTRGAFQPLPAQKTVQKAEQFGDDEAIAGKLLAGIEAKLADQRKWQSG